MADLSAETQAIIQRLKDEGELVRNRGTNSIRSVKIEMSKFKGVFDVISANIVEQTSILRQQAGFAADALEAQRSKEQFDEVEKESTNRNNSNTDVDAESKRKTDENINKMSEAISNAFSLKNLALTGAGLFVGYNIIKGFIDEQTGGGFTAMESKLGEFANFDLNAIKLQFDQLTTDISAMGTSLASISTSLGTIVETFDTIANMGFLDAAALLLSSIGAAQAGFWSLKYIMKRLTLDLDNGTKPKGGVSWWRRALGLGPDVDTPPRPGPPGPPGTGAGGARPAGAASAPPAAVPGGSRSSYGMNTPAERAQLRAGVAASLPDQYRVDSKGRLQNRTGGVVSDQQAEKILQDTLKNMKPKYAKAFNLIKGLITKVGLPILATVAALEIAFILADENMTDEQKMQALAPILGSIFGGIGFAVLGAAIGTFGGPWGTLIGGIVGGIAGSIAGEQLGYYIAKWAFGEEPTEEERRAMVAEREASAAATNEFAGYTDPLSFDVTPTPPSTPTPMGPQNVRPRPTSQGGRNQSQDLWDREYAATHNADGTPRGGRGSIVERPGERAAYQAMVDSLVESENAAQRRIDEVSRAGSGTTVVVVNAPTNVSPVVNNVTGGKSVSQVSIRGGGGADSGMFGSSNPYGLPLMTN